MPKFKTNSSAKKRFKFTGTGKIKRKQAGVRHYLDNKTTKTKRMLGNAALVSAADKPKIKRMLT